MPKDIENDWETLTLEDARKEIDRIDEAMKKLFDERMKTAEQIAAIKYRTGDEIYKPDREKAVIEMRSKEISPEIRDSYIDFLQNMMRISREYQSGLISKWNDK